MWIYKDILFDNKLIFFLKFKFILFNIESGCNSKDKGDNCNEKMNIGRLFFYSRVKVN